MTFIINNNIVILKFKDRISKANYPKQSDMVHQLVGI